MKQETKVLCKRALLPFVALLIILCGICFMFFGISPIQKIFYPKKYKEFVTMYAKEYHVEEEIIYSIIRTESGFQEDAESQVGARGLMQITQETFDWIKLKIAPQEDIVFDDLYDAQTNIRFGTYLLSYCLERYHGDLSTAAAAYHSGIGLVDSLVQNKEYSKDQKTLFSFPYAQMNHYVKKVNANYKSYQNIYGDTL